MYSDKIYDLLKSGIAPEDLVKSINDGARKLEAEKKAEEERKQKEAKKASLLEKQRIDLATELVFYLNVLGLIKDEVMEDDDLFDEEVEKIAKALKRKESDLLSTYKSWEKISKWLDEVEVYFNRY